MQGGQGLSNDVMDARDVNVKNVTGSTAGASSGDFHVFRHQRRKELERIEQMESDARRKAENDKRLKALSELKTRDELKTAKRAAKRRRRKERRVQAAIMLKSSGEGSQQATGDLYHSKANLGAAGMRENLGGGGQESMRAASEPCTENRNVERCDRVENKQDHNAKDRIGGARPYIAE